MASIGRGRRLGIFGGTFDPIHLGHLVAAQEVLEALELDRVLFVPSARPPHKDPAGLTPADLRLRMVRAAIRGDERFEALDLELRREGPSYTAETVKALGDGEPDARLHLIVGVDQWAAFGSWKDPGAIVRLARPVVVAREGDRAAAIEPRMPGGEPAPESTEVPVTRLDISSTRLRERIREGGSIRYLVPDEVRRIIEADELYVREP